MVSGWRERRERWGGGVIGCERENSAQCVLHPHMYMYLCMVVSVIVKGRESV